MYVCLMEIRKTILYFSKFTNKTFSNSQYNVKFWEPGSKIVEFRNLFEWKSTTFYTKSVHRWNQVQINEGSQWKTKD
jgi:hypothetical protein